MFALLGRLLALRPLLGVAVLGIPVLALIAIGLTVVVVGKILLFVVLPIALVWWIVKRVLKPHDDLAAPSAE
jgi:type IV secretory pathway VirB3-like protein